MNTIFKHGNRELQGLIQLPSLENLVSYFNARTLEWCETAISMECFTVGTFYDLCQSFKDSAAFDLLNLAAEMETNHFPDKKFIQYIDLLGDLARCSDTTERPPNLTKSWNELIARAKTIEASSIKLNSLITHYKYAPRIDS